jgi:Core-2/I-Branching enzyme
MGDPQLPRAATWRHGPTLRKTTVARRALRLGRGYALALRAFVRSSPRKGVILGTVLVATLVVPLLVLCSSTGALRFPRSHAETNALDDRCAAMLRREMSRVEKFGAAWRVRQAQLGNAPAVPRSKTEARIAYFVQIGGDSIKLLPRLFARIHHPDNVYVLHVDAKIDARAADGVRALVDNNLAFRRNMHFLPSEMVTYKGISMVLNTIGGMTLARRVDSGWDYFINISGADYPLLSPTAQRRLLARPAVAPGLLNFMTLFPKSEWEPYSFRIKSQYWDPAIVGFQHRASRLVRMDNHRLNPLEPHRGFLFAKAEAWTILSRPFCEFIIRSPFAKRMLLSHLHVLSAPEHYFADVLFNHPVWRKTLVQDALRKVVWYHRRRRSGQHPYLLDKGKGDSMFDFWPYIRQTRSLFARKMSKPDSPLLLRIDQLISGAVPASNESRIEAEESIANFSARLSTHFDEITVRALRTQDVKLPSHAYPKD